MRYKLVLPLLSLLTASPAAWAENAQPSPFILNGRYTIAWSGIPLGRIILVVSEDATHYSMSIDTKTKGLASLISDEKREITVNGTKTADGTYRATRYQSRPHKKDDNDTITLTYDEKGNLLTREYDNPDDPAWRPVVPVEEVNTAHDPITAAFMLRRTLYAALNNGTATINTRTYDGDRLAEMSLVRAANSKVAIMDSYIDTINVAVKRDPINGYTPKELKKYNKGDPEIRIYFSNDAAFIPVRASAKTLIGELSMTLVEKE